MKYINVENGSWVIYDKENKKIISTFNVEELRDELNKLNSRLEEIPEAPSDEVLLAWAKENYPMIDYSKEIGLLTKRISEINSILVNVQ